MAKLASRKLELEEFNQLFIVEYSVSQNSVGVKSVNEMLEANRLNLARQRASDYLPVAALCDARRSCCFFKQANR